MVGRAILRLLWAYLTLKMYIGITMVSYGDQNGWYWIAIALAQSFALGFYEGVLRKRGTSNRTSAP